MTALTSIEALPAAKLARLPPAQLARLTEVLRELDRRERQRLFHHMFPDETHEWLGETYHARDLYPKHLEFFEAGRDYRERCAMAANRCVTPWTWLDVPGGARLSADMWTSADAVVQSWDGERQCIGRPSHGTLLGIEQAFRVVLGSGRFFDCNHRHRVLTAEGWLSLSQIVSRADGLRCWHTREGYQASCDAGGYLGDRPLREIAGIGLEQPPSLVGAQKRAPMIFGLEDAAEPTLQRIRAFQQCDRLSNRDDLRRFAALFGLLAGPSSEQPVLSLSDTIPTALQSVLASLPPHASGEFHRAALEGGKIQAALEKTVHDAACMQQPWARSFQGVELFLSCEGRSGSIGQWLHGDGRTAIFYPLAHPVLVGGETIAAIVPLGLQPIIDAHVPGWNNYFAGGVVHHNTGKTLGMGGYETACHLTGLYPRWWPGRRFDRPIEVWAAGKTNETTRDIVQTTLLGPVGGSGATKRLEGTGVVPGAALGRPTWKQGVQNLVDTIPVRHASGGWSTLGLKSYDQGRGAFEGTAKHLIWLDEEPPLDVYGECLIRTATTRGLVMLTFTPLVGMSQTVLQFLPKEG